MTILILRIMTTCFHSFKHVELGWVGPGEKVSEIAVEYILLVKAFNFFGKLVLATFEKNDSMFTINLLGVAGPCFDRNTSIFIMARFCHMFFADLFAKLCDLMTWVLTCFLFGTAVFFFCPS